MGSVKSSAALLVLAPAGWVPETEGHERAYYATPPDVRYEVLSQCRNDPGRYWATGQCQNAMAAESDAEHARVFHGDSAHLVGLARRMHL